MYIPSTTLYRYYYPRCDGYNSRPDTDSAPPAMLALDLWLPPSHHVDTWGLVDAGQLGPAVRLGWFMPSRTAAMFPPTMDHWKILLDYKTAEIFFPSQEEEEQVVVVVVVVWV